MGGSISVAICSAILHNTLDNLLEGVLTSSQIALLKDSLASLPLLPTSAANSAREAFGHSYNLQFRVLTAFAGADVIIAILLLLAVHKREKAALRQDLGISTEATESARVTEEKR
jgi:hypothetical protein